MPNVFGFSSTIPPATKAQTYSNTSSSPTILTTVDKEDIRDEIGKLEYLFRFLSFVTVFGISIWCFSAPVSAIEAITTIDVDEQTAFITDLVIIAVTSSNTTGLLAQANDMSPIEDIMTVIVRVFASLMLISCGGILAIPGLLSRILVICSQIVATIFFIVAAVEDDGAILQTWFTVLYSVFACGVPALFMTVEAVREGRKLRQS